MGEPLGTAGVVLLKDLSIVVGLFTAWGVVRERLVSFLHLVIVHLREKKMCRQLMHHV